VLIGLLKINMRLNIEKQTIILVGIFSTIIVAIILGIILPTVKYIKNLNQETAALKEYLERKYENTANLRSSIKKIEEIKNVVNGYSQYFFEPGDELYLITTLENIANKNKVNQKIENSNLDQPNQEMVKMTLTINGEYERVLKYLADIERIDYFINIEKLQLAAASLKHGEVNVSSTPTNLYLDLSLYEIKR